MPLKPGYSRATINANIAQMVKEGYPVNRAVAAALRTGREWFFRKHPKGFPPWHLRTIEEKQRTGNTGRRMTNPIGDVDVIIDQLAEYGYSLDEMNRIVTPKGAATGVIASFRKGRIRVTDVSGKLMFSGSDIGNFLEKFWYAKKIKRAQNPVPASSRVTARQQIQIEEAAALYADFSGHEPEIVGTLDKPVIPDVLIGIGEIDGVMYSTVRDGKLEKYVHQFKKTSRPLFAVSHDGKQLYMLGGAYTFTERGIVDKS